MKHALTVIVAFFLVMSGSPAASPVAVRHPEGLVHGFLTLHTLDGKSLASGDMIQTTRGDQVTTRLVFQFRDGSTHDETAVYSQNGRFRLLSNRLIQKGPAFEQPLEMTIDRSKGQVVVTYKDEDGADKIETEKMDLPVDLANGMIITLLKNVQKSSGPMEWSYVAATPKPRLVKLDVRSAGAESFSIAGSARKATHYVLKVEIGGIAGLVAPLIGKQPPDSHVWVLEGEAPAFVKSELAMFAGGPMWRMELTSPVWR